MVNKSNVSDNSADQKSIRVNVEFHGTGENKTPSARAYLFDLYGRFMTSKPVEGKSLTFEVNAGQKSYQRGCQVKNTSPRRKARNIFPTSSPPPE